MLQLILGLVLFVSGAASANGFDKEKIRRTVRENLKDVKACYEDELEKNQKLQGKAVMGWTITDTGMAKDVKVVQSLKKEVDECLTQKITTWKFPAAPKGKTAVIEAYPFVFNPAAPEPSLKPDPPKAKP